MFKLCMLLVLAICASAFIPKTIATCTETNAHKTFKRSVYDFTVNLMTKISEENDYHFIASPVSIWNVLSLISMGAYGDTLSELEDVLKLHPNECFNRKYLAITTKANIVNETDVFLEHTSAIFADENLKFTRFYEKKVITSGLSSLERINFGNPDSAAVNINEYISRITRNTIDEIVTPGDLENVKMVITDAIYFKGLWQIPFKTDDTEIGDFFDHNRKKTGNVNYMTGYDTFDLAYVDLIKAKVLRLPYGNGERYSMLLFLPYKQVPLFSVVKNLDKINLDSIKSLYRKYDQASVMIKIPRFKITSDHNNLKELLIDMNLKAVFDSSQADLSLMTRMPLYLSNVIQKADIEVTEDGSTASAASAAEIGWRSGPDEFFADKPFLFMIIDYKYKIPIFTGAYSKPSVF